jgi:hypothetical protein
MKSTTWFCEPETGCAVFLRQLAIKLKGIGDRLANQDRVFGKVGHQRLIPDVQTENTFDIERVLVTT